MEAKIERKIGKVITKIDLKKTTPEKLVEVLESITDEPFYLETVEYKPDDKKH